MCVCVCLCCIKGLQLTVCVPAPHPLPHVPQLGQPVVLSRRGQRWHQQPRLAQDAEQPGKQRNAQTQQQFALITSTLPAARG